MKNLLIFLFLSFLINSCGQTEKSTTKAKVNSEFDETSGIKFTKLDGELINRLDILGKVWGFLKYYHPEVAAGKSNWDYELFRILPAYLESKNNMERNKILIKWIEKLGAISKCKDCEETSPGAYLKPDFTWIKKSDLGSELVNLLMNIYKNRQQGKQFYIQLMPYVGNPKFINENPYDNMPYPDAGYRLLALYRYWNIIQYFFPNKHLTDKNWDEVLREYIPKFINAKNELEYELAALQIIGDLKDTHANLWGGNDKIQEMRGRFYAPFRVQFVEDKLVVTDYYNPEFKKAAGLIIGDVITSINNNPTENIIDSLSKYYPASNKAARLRDMAVDLLRSPINKIRINYISDGQELTKDLTLYARDSLDIYGWYRRDDEPCFKILDGNIGYITLKSIKDKDIKKIKKSFKSTKGIIIDIRNYPSTFVPFSLGSYFVSSERPFVKFTIGNLNNPGEFTFIGGPKIPKPSETYKGKLIVMVNEYSQSQAEYTAMAFRAGDNTTIIGSTTAGADGNVSRIFLPGSLNTLISGIGVFYPDGKETQRVGIVPDIIVKPTIQGIKQGKDELLDRAIHLINQ